MASRYQQTSFDQLSNNPLVSETYPTNPRARSTRPEIDIRPSSRRKKTGSAYFSNGRIIVNIPARLSAKERDSMVEWLVERVVKRIDNPELDDAYLMNRATRLSSQYLNGILPSSIRWVSNQNTRWGSCTFETKEIRISDRLLGVPSWVIDSVVFHELVHLIVPDHSRAFYELANKFPRTNNAQIYLDGYSLGLGKKGDRGDLNPRPPGPQPGALTN